jgi:uncharacterized Zn finger protein
VVSRRRFGATWWGRAWIDALEQRARLDPNRLPRGRTYARHGHAGDLSIEPGLVSAQVQGRQPCPYRVRVRVRPFNDAEWDALLTAIASRAAHAAALLDGELPPETLDDAARAGVDLLPGPGELGPSCTCPDWADPCKHAAAVCYLVADVLDADPFALLHLRGRPREAVLAALRAQRSVPTSARRRSRPAVSHGSVVARDVYARDTVEVGDLFALGSATTPTHPGRPAPLAVDPPPGSGIRADDLAALAADAVARAFALATGDGDGDLALDTREDLARRAAAVLGTPAFAGLAGQAGVSPRHLARDAIAWAHGGREGLAVLHVPWSPEPNALDEARDALAANGLATQARQNRISTRDIQLRLGRSGLWYRFDRHTCSWDLAGPPSADPGALLTRSTGTS